MPAAVPSQTTPEAGSATNSPAAPAAGTTTGVPQASASSVARPKLSTGEGSSAASHPATSCARSRRPAMWPRKVTGRPIDRRRSRLRIGPSPSTSRRAGTPRARRIRIASIARSGCFSRDSRLTMISRTVDSVPGTAAAGTRAAGSAYPGSANAGSGGAAGRNVSRSTPSGTRSRFGAPARRNSAAENLDVTTT